MAKEKTGTAAKAGGVAKYAELSAMLQETVELEKETRNTGPQASYLKLIGNTAGDPILKKGKAEYIEGAKDGSWVIPMHKLYLGEEVPITVLGIFDLYEDSIDGDGKDGLRQVVGYWLPEDAQQYPKDGPFDRPYTDNEGNEHLLKPVSWAFLHLHEHPEVTDAVLTFRSKGLKICTDLRKQISANSSSCTELRFILSNQEIEAKAYGRAFVYPLFDFDGKNYKAEDGVIQGLIKDGFDEETLAEVLKRSSDLHKSYNGNKLVEKREVKQIEDKNLAF